MQFRLNEIKRIKDCFIAETCEREIMSKTLSNQFAAFDDFNKTLLVLSATNRGVSIASFVTVVGAPVVITSRSISWVFSISKGNFKNLLKTMKKRKKT